MRTPHTQTLAGFDVVAPENIVFHNIRSREIIEFKVVMLRRICSPVRVLF